LTIIRDEHADRIAAGLDRVRRADVRRLGDELLGRVRRR
jgi:hypothetical protein